MANAGEVAGAVVTPPFRLRRRRRVRRDRKFVCQRCGMGLTVVDPALPKLRPIAIAAFRVFAVGAAWSLC